VRTITPPQGSRKTQSRISNFVFTLNNWTQEEYDRLIEKLQSVRWACVAKETGENGTPHLQGAVAIGRQVAFSTIKTWPGLARAHLEQMHGTPQDSLAYCSKQDSNPVLIGVLPNPGIWRGNLMFLNLFSQAEMDLVASLQSWDTHTGLI